MPATPLLIRTARAEDAPALLAIYSPFVEQTTVSFELYPPTLEQFADRIRKYGMGWSWMVAERKGAVVGYAYASPHRERAAYRWSVETSAYVAPDAHRQGVGRRLYGELFADLRQKGFCNAYAGITLPNDASIALHRSSGFEPIGVFPSVGRKFGVWHAVAWFHRRLREAPLLEADMDPENAD